MARQALSLKARAIGLLAQREHSRIELRRKLLSIERRLRAASAAAAAASAARAVEGGAADARSGAVYGTSYGPACDARSNLEPAAGAATAPACEALIDDETHANDEIAACESAVDALLDALAADGYLDETRFVESRVHVRAQRFGVHRIQQELAQHGLRLDPEQQSALRASELDRAREVWVKRFGTGPGREPAEQAKQTRFLLARGFSPDLVRRLLRSQGCLD